MKRAPFLLLATALLLPGQSASGQTTLGLHGGVNVAILDDVVEDTIVVTKYLRMFRPTYGLNATFMLTPPEGLGFGVRLNASYAPKGADRAGGSEYAIRLTYLELAALADVRVPLIFDPVDLHFLIGAAMGWLRSCARRSPCVEGEFSSRDVGVSFGTQLEIALTRGVGFTAGGLYNVGISNAYGREKPVLKNRSVALTGGLSFRIG